MATPEIKLREVEKLFDKGFSFEGNNDPNITPKMMFVIHPDGSKSLATPAYFKAFIREAVLSAQQEVLKEILKYVQEDVDFGAEHQQIVSTKAQAKILELLAEIKGE